MSDLKLTGLNSSPDFSREIKTEKTSASKAGKKTRLSRDAFISGAKKAGRAAKEAGSCLVPEGYKKIYRGEKLDKYEIAETAGITALYGALIVGTGGAAGLALYAGGLSTMVGSGIIKHRKGIAKAARKLAGKLNPKHLAKKVKDGSAKAALKKLKHPKALLAAAGTGAAALLAAAPAAAANSSAAWPQEPSVNPYWNMLYYGNQLAEHSNNAPVALASGDYAILAASMLLVGGAAAYALYRDHKNAQNPENRGGNGYHYMPRI